MIAVEKWFVLGPEGPIGPVTIDQLRRGLAAGKVPSDSVVSPEGSPAWTPIEEVLAEMSARDRAEIAAALGNPSVIPPSPHARSSVAPLPIPRPQPSRKSAEAPAPVAPSPAAPSVRAPVVAAPSAPVPSARAAAPVVVAVPVAPKTDPRPVSDTSLIPVVPVPAAPKTDPRPVSDTSLLPSLPPSQRPSRHSGEQQVPPPADSAPTLIRGATRDDFLDIPFEPPAREPAAAKARPSVAPPAPRPAAATAPAGDPRYAQATLACAVTAVLLLGALAYRAWEPRKIDREQIHADALAVLTKHEGLKRAARCEQALGDLDELTKGKPYAVERTSVPDLCRAVSKGRPGSAHHGGFVLSPVAECGRLEAALPRDVSRHEEKLSAIVSVTCSADRKPSALPDDAAKLTARASADVLMPRLLRDAAAGSVQGSLLACYDGTIAGSATTGREERKLRCSILKARTGTALPASTTLQRAGLESSFEAYRAEHAAGLAALRAQDREHDLVDGFLARAEAQACATGTEVGRADDGVRASARAVAGCLGAE